MSPGTPTSRFCVALPPSALHFPIDTIFAVRAAEFPAMANGMHAALPMPVILQQDMPRTARSFSPAYHFCSGRSQYCGLFGAEATQHARLRDIYAQQLPHALMPMVGARFDCAALTLLRLMRRRCSRSARWPISAPSGRREPR